MDNMIQKEFIIDYFSKYSFFEIDDFKKEEEGEYILKKINECNRFDYNGYTYKYSKFNNVVKGETNKNVKILIDENNDTLVVDGEITRLDLNFKYEKKQLEDHVRVAKKVCNKNNELSCLIYIKNEYSKEFLNSLDKIKSNQEKILENRLQ
ncbi:hypothetical protein [Paraclostridium sordellii]|uniref:hypothetical protein n=1 Tax=Paraclostridium sordellii TaxID=1505 RepID=UPI0005DEAD30|nr:hypothetical protein [Paeniclostridium sordellii]CEN84357.1 Uncharacterised protein [[Clostridium] sordellii] [Paeniclostridium sordellii]CEO11651.1 Uncharacterised protein [[Clostridium] sordellii] [Paeniclostridium sordellii]CEO28763.1 Uncharacterised protein [[Clostridium] sordellii] [Paeniclostridium sordellii]CEQ15774.1 Uncharacterised protein [[Clostridium] sordellii] [Paeniclostridium sordellii]